MLFLLRPMFDEGLLGCILFYAIETVSSLESRASASRSFCVPRPWGDPALLQAG